MALAKMSVAELERFLRDEFPQAFSGDDITIESAHASDCTRCAWRALSRARAPSVDRST